MLPLFKRLSVAHTFSQAAGHRLDLKDTPSYSTYEK